MNRQQALEWLVENVTKWNEHSPIPKGYYWITNHGVLFCVSKGAPDMEVITQQDWLDATDNMEKKDDE